MDKAERTRLKRLANDAVIATFGSEGRESQLAVALEQCVDELGVIAEECDHCKTCPDHGDVEDDSIAVDVNELIRIHGELKKQVQAFKDLHRKFDDVEDATDVPDLTGEMGLQIEEFESNVDELEAEVSL